MPEVHHTWAQVRVPKDENDLGQVTEGYYTLAGDVLTMTDKTGVPMRNLSGGAKFTHTLKPGEDPLQVSSRLTLQIYRMLHGDLSGFNRPITYEQAVWR